MKLIRIPRKDEVRNEIPAALTDDMSISAEAKILWIKLYNSNRVKGDYKKWTPSTQSLAIQFEVKKLSIKRWMKELKDTGWISIVGNRNDTNLFINYTPVLVSKKIPALVSKKIPYTIKDAFAPKVGEMRPQSDNSEDEKTGEENDTSFEFGINNEN